jgi:pimeloyl-ACP methyl ester carboxylesterase
VPEAKHTPASHLETVAGVGLHWTEWGQGSPVVVLHGLQDTERTWWRVAEVLARRHRVFALDLPGCGLSERPDASYTIDWQAEIVSSWLDRLGLSSLDVVAHSYGGGVAMWLLLYRASSIHKLALVAPGGLGRDVGVALRLASLPGVASLAQPFMGTTTCLMTEFHGAGLPVAEREYLRQVNGLPGSARAFARTVNDVIDCRGQKRHFLDRARELAALPAMRLFWGERDHVIPISHGERLATVLRNTQLVRFAHHGHFLHWSCPHALAAELLDYFATPDHPRAEIIDGERSLA